MLLKLFFTGSIILITAIIANILVSYINISTWYTFLDKAWSNGLKEAMNQQSVLNIIWLFIIYPIILSLGYMIGETIYNLIH